jgi:hypothetical protein
LEVGLNNPENIFCSTIDQADIDIMQSMISNNQLPLKKKNVFQFDFLNDEFDTIIENIVSGKKSYKLPTKFRDIIKDEVQRKKLIIYINPPYAEAGNKKVMTGTGKHKAGVSTDHKLQDYYEKYGSATNELFAKFFIRINEELNAILN